MMCVIECETDDATSAGFHTDARLFNARVPSLPSVSKESFLKTIVTITDVINRKNNTQRFFFFHFLS